MYKTLAYLVLFVSIVSCTQDQTIITAELMLDEDPHLFWAATYHLPNGKTYFDNPDLWHGQPPGAFKSQLYADEKTRVMKRLNEFLLSKGNEYQHLYYQRYVRWISTYRSLHEFASKTSLEESLAAIYDWGEFEHLFGPAFENRGLSTEEFSSIQLVSMLTGAEATSIFQQVVTELSALPTQSAQEYLKSIKSHSARKKNDRY
jgi:hypothetical protein